MFGANPIPRGFGFSDKNIGTAAPFVQGPASTFGTPGAYGTQSPAATDGLCGQTQSSTATGGLFGSQPATGTFGQQSSGFTFGATPAAASGSTRGLFGQTQGQSGGLFSTPSSNDAKVPGFGGFGTTSTPAAGGLFGQQTQQATAASLFGQPSSSDFGQTNTPVGTTLKFNPQLSQDTVRKNGVFTTINTRHQCITAMKEYQSKSLEELRVEDYLANRKGKQNAIFGATPSTASTGFGFAKPQTGFSTSGFTSTPESTSSSLFGQQSQASGPFGQQSQASGLFGQQSQASGLFGQQSRASGLFGQQGQASGLFGTAATSAPTGFGCFGTSTSTGTSLFGNATKTAVFGMTAATSAPSLFGNTSTFRQPAVSTGFGIETTQSTPLFGSATASGAQGFVTQSTHRFDKPATTFQTGGLFGNTGFRGTAGTFGTPGAFGTQTPAATGGLFGQTQTSTATGGLFGSQPATGTYGQPSSRFINSSEPEGYEDVVADNAMDTSSYGNYTSKARTSLQYPLGNTTCFGQSEEDDRLLYNMDRNRDEANVLNRTRQRTITLSARGGANKDSSGRRLTAKYLTSDIEQRSTSVQDTQPPHPAGVLLSRPGYYTIPSLEELTDMVDEKQECVVDGFTIGREGYGKLFFPDKFSVANLNLDEIVHIQRNEVTIYPDDDNKPPRGKGLNRKAVITLKCDWSTDETTNSLITTSSGLLPDREELKQRVCNIGGTFIDYRATTESLVFEVEHFSKYKVDGKENTLHAAENKKTSQSVQNKSDPFTESVALLASDTYQAAEMNLRLRNEDDEDGSRLKVFQTLPSGQKKYTVQSSKKSNTSFVSSRKSFTLRNKCKEETLIVILMRALDNPHVKQLFEHSRLESIKKLYQLLKEYSRNEETVLVELAKLGGSFEVNLKKSEVNSDTNQRTEESCLRKILEDVRVKVLYSACDKCGKEAIEEQVELIEVLKMAVSQKQYRNGKNYDLSGALASLTTGIEVPCDIKCREKVLRTCEILEGFEPPFFPVPLYVTSDDGKSCQLFELLSAIPKNIPSILEKRVTVIALSFQTLQTQGFHIQPALLDTKEDSWYYVPFKDPIFLEDGSFLRKKGKLSMAYYFPTLQ